MNKCIILQGCHHEEGKVYTTGKVAGEDGIAYMLTPYRQPLALTFFQIASPHDCPQGVTGKNATTGFNLVIDIYQTGKPANPTGKLLFSLKRPGVDIFTISSDMPATGKYERAPDWA